MEGVDVDGAGTVETESPTKLVTGGGDVSSKVINAGRADASTGSGGGDMVGVGVTGSVPPNVWLLWAVSFIIGYYP